MNRKRIVVVAVCAVLLLGMGFAIGLLAAHMLGNRWEFKINGNGTQFVRFDTWTGHTEATIDGRFVTFYP